MRHIKSCRAGEIICDKGGNRARVLGRLGVLIFRSEFYREDVAAHHFMTWMEAEREGWKILGKDGREPYKKKDIENLMNIKVVD